MSARTFYRITVVWPEGRRSVTVVVRGRDRDDAIARATDEAARRMGVWSGYLVPDEIEETS